MQCMHGGMPTQQGVVLHMQGPGRDSMVGHTTDEQKEFEGLQSCITDGPAHRVMTEMQFVFILEVT